MPFIIQIYDLFFQHFMRPLKDILSTSDYHTIFMCIEVSLSSLLTDKKNNVGDLLPRYFYLDIQKMSLNKMTLFMHSSVS